MSGGQRKEFQIESSNELAPSETAWCPCPGQSFPPLVSSGLKLESGQPNSIGVSRDNHSVQDLGNLPQPVLGINGRALPCVARAQPVKVSQLLPQPILLRRCLCRESHQSSNN